MIARRARTLAAITAVIPLGAAALWLTTGRGVFTKSAKFVDVTVTDELFGDTIVEKGKQQGPVVGYYVGLDAVLICTASWLVAGAVLWRLRRRGRDKVAARERESHAT